MAVILPTFKGYTVDLRLRQFRKVVGGKLIFVEFCSPEGDELLGQFVSTLSKKRDMLMLKKISNLF